MRRSRAPSNWPGPFFAARSWAGCTTNMFGFDLRQAQRENSNEPAAEVTAADSSYDLSRLSDEELSQLESILSKVLRISAETADTNQGGERR
jgi:hypothetical protein